MLDFLWIPCRGLSDGATQPDVSNIGKKCIFSFIGHSGKKAHVECKRCTQRYIFSFAVYKHRAQFFPHWGYTRPEFIYVRERTPDLHWSEQANCLQEKK